MKIQNFSLILATFVFPLISAEAADSFCPLFSGGYSTNKDIQDIFTATNILMKAEQIKALTPDTNMAEQLSFEIKDLKDSREGLKKAIEQRDALNRLIEEGIKEDGADEKALRRDLSSTASQLRVYPSDFIQVSDASKLTGKKKEIYQTLHDGKAIKFSDVTDAFIEDECGGQNVNVGEEKSVIDILVGKSQSGDLASTKISTEAALEQFPGRTLVYNKDASNLSDPSRNFKLQCRSGSYLLETILRKSQGAEIYGSRNFVTVFTAGHMLPGQMVKNEKGEWELKGIETTVAGKGEVNFNELGSLANAQQGFVVADAEMTLLLELFRNEISNPDQAAQLVIGATEAKYGIRASLVGKNGSGSGAINSATSAQKSNPLAFGETPVEAGDHPRIKADSVPALSVISSGESVALSTNIPPMGLYAGAQIDDGRLVDALHMVAEPALAAYLVANHSSIYAYEDSLPRLSKAIANVQTGEDLKNFLMNDELIVHLNTGEEESQTPYLSNYFVRADIFALAINQAEEKQKNPFLNRALKNFLDRLSDRERDWISKSLKARLRKDILEDIGLIHYEARLDSLLKNSTNDQ